MIWVEYFYDVDWAFYVHLKLGLGWGLLFIKGVCGLSIRNERIWLIFFIFHRSNFQKNVNEPPSKYCIVFMLTRWILGSCTWVSVLLMYISSAREKKHTHNKSHVYKKWNRGKCERAMQRKTLVGFPTLCGVTLILSKTINTWGNHAMH